MCRLFKFITTHNARVHKHIIVAMAVLETGYGKSRFATEGNNLFGIRTWDPKSSPTKTQSITPDAEFGVKMYKPKCDSVKDMVAIINRHLLMKNLEQKDNSKLTQVN